jgi:hypothetical protein
MTARTPGPARRSSTTWPSAWNTATVTTPEMKAWAAWSNLSTPGISHVSYRIGAPWSGDGSNPPARCTAPATVRATIVARGSGQRRCPARTSNASSDHTTRYATTRRFRPAIP